MKLIDEDNRSNDSESNEDVDNYLVDAYDDTFLNYEMCEIF